jgi:hypothetical protein
MTCKECNDLFGIALVGEDLCSHCAKWCDIQESIDRYMWYDTEMEEQFYIDRQGQ